MMVFTFLPGCMFCVNILTKESLSGRDCSWKKPRACPKKIYYDTFTKVGEVPYLTLTVVKIYTLIIQKMKLSQYVLAASIKSKIFFQLASHITLHQYKIAVIAPERRKRVLPEWGKNNNMEIQSFRSYFSSSAKGCLSHREIFECCPFSHNTCTVEVNCTDIGKLI